MFHTNKISRNSVTEQFVYSCNVGSSTTAKDIQARYLGYVRERFGFSTEIGHKDSIVTIASNSPDTIKEIVDKINKDYHILLL